MVRRIGILVWLYIMILSLSSRMSNLPTWKDADTFVVVGIAFDIRRLSETRNEYNSWKNKES